MKLLILLRDGLNRLFHYLVTEFRRQTTNVPLRLTNVDTLTPENSNGQLKADLEEVVLFSLSLHLNWRFFTLNLLSTVVKSPHGFH